MNKYLRGVKPRLQTATGVIRLSNREAEVRFLKKVLVELERNQVVLKRQIKETKKQLK